MAKGGLATRLLLTLTFSVLINWGACVISDSKAMARVAVVTGANKGIGLAIARKIGGLPGHLCIVAARNEQRGKQAASKLKEEGLIVEFKQLDIDDPTSVQRFASEMESEFGRCDILVNNAGIAFKGSDPTPFRDQAEPTVNTNFFNTVSFTESMMPLVRRSTAGRVVNVASRSGHLSIIPDGTLRRKFESPTLSKEELSSLMAKFVEDVQNDRHRQEGWASTCYGMSKLGLIAYTKVVARIEQESGSGVLVNACCPGYCDTDMTSHKGPRPAEEGALTPFMLSQLPDGGLAGEFFGEERPLVW